MRHLFKVHLVFLVLVCACALYRPSIAISQTIELEDVLKSSALNFPKIQEALAKIDETEGKITASLGAFDSTVEGSYYRRMSGFYSGRIQDTKIVKPFQNFNAKASIGYRRSDGTFPIYEDYFFTNDDGELNAKLSLSLLRNRDIDPRRFKLFQNKIELDQSKLNLLATQLSVQSDAYQAYLDWVAAGFELKVYRSLLAIAEDRQSALEQKVERGDLPDIALIENTQFILQRREVVEEAKRKLENTANFLSMFMRDDSGDPYAISTKNLPKTFPMEKNISLSSMNDAMNTIVALNPNLRQLDNEISQAVNRVKLGENAMKPSVDLELSAADDFGDGSQTREDFESAVRLNVSFPLQTRLGEGEIQQGNAIKRQIEHRKNLQLEQLRVGFENILSNVRAAQKILNITAKEIEVTKKMETAERKRFENGQSDFFLVNIREINTVNAQIDNIKAKKYLSSAYANYLVAILDTDRLGIELQP